MSDVTVAQAVPLKGIPDVELVAQGAWNASTGPAVITSGDLKGALAALGCPGVHNPVLKLGHQEPDPDEQKMRWDGEPAVGWVSNMRLSANGAKLLGDYTGMPGWLADVAASAYPQRSVEIARNMKCQIGHTHPFVITAVSLLGVVPPAVGVLRSLNDVQALYTLAAFDGRPPPEVTGSIARHLAAAPARPARRDLTPTEQASKADFARDRAEWDAAVASLLKAYRPVQKAQRAQLAAQIAPLIDSGRYDALATVSVDDSQASDMIYAEMLTAAQAAIDLQIAEAAAQGITGLLAYPDEFYLRDLAAGIAGSMASSLSATAGRNAAQLASPGVTGASVAATVDTKLSDLSDRFLHDQFAGAVGAARASGRHSVLSVAPDGTYTAAEVNDDNTCHNCEIEDGTRFPNLDAAMTAYGAGGYRLCSGGSRCRGRLVAVWNVATTPSPPTPVHTFAVRSGNRVLMARVLTTLGFDPTEQRAGDGKWTDGAPGAGAAKKAAHAAEALSSDQYAALHLKDSDYHTAVDELEKTDAGKNVMEFARTHIATFTGAANNADDTWMLAKGMEVKDAKRAARAKAFIEASRHTPPDLIPPVLHRGMTIPPDEFDDFKKEHAPGNSVDIGASSFSSSRATASTYANDPLGDSGVGVMVEFDTTDGAQALPVDLLNRKAKFDEYVAMGKFEVTSFEPSSSKRGQWTMKMKQTGMF